MVPTCRKCRQKYLRDREISQLRNVIVAQLRIHHAPVLYDDFLEQCRAECLSHTTFHLTTQLRRVQHGTGVSGLDRLQNDHPARCGIHRDPKSVDVERHRPRRAVVVPVRRERSAVEERRESDEIGCGGDAVRGEFDRMPTHGLCACEYPIAQALARDLESLARHDRAGRAEGPVSCPPISVSD